MNPIVKYILYGFQFVFLSWIIIGLSNYISIFYALIITIFASYIIPHMISYAFRTHESKSLPDLDNLKLFSNRLSKEHNINKVEIHVSNENSGKVQYNYKKLHQVYIPNEANPYSEGIESKAVIAHELSHIIHKDRTVYEISRSILILMSGLSLYIVQSYMGIFNIILTSVLILIIVPSILNYIVHEFEYRADKFAVANTSKRAVSIRLRKNQKYLNDSWYRKLYPYVMPHPPVEQRLSKIYDLD